jgi:hypothetical protein
MPTDASQIFNFLDQHPACSIERHEIAASDFGALRRGLRSIVVRLRDAYDLEAQALSDRLRMHLSEWLTVPVPFDGAILEAVQILGDRNAVRDRWGQDIRVLYDAAVRAARDLTLGENPVRAKVRAVIHGLRAGGQTFRIYCHRRARPHFESLLGQSDAPLEDRMFLHTVRDYRDAEPFDALIKVGPLRSRGWGSAPDALISAPRFATLDQIVWSGCNDEPGFGYDPTAPPAELGSTPAKGPVAEHGSLSHRISWISRTTRSGEDSGTVTGGEIEPDEFQIFREFNHIRENRRATLVEIHAEQGILYPPYSHVLSFDPTPHANEPIGYRLPGETLVEGMFVILSLHSDVDLGGSDARRGVYSQAWKTRLAAKYRADPHGLVRQLRSGGINLIDLYSCIERWSSSVADVLPAPGQRRHFQILTEVLGVDWDGNIPSKMQGILWAECAWNEIRRARGEAIQTGRDEHELIDEELLSILKDLLCDIRLLSAMHDVFVLPIPAGRALRGIIRFYKVYSVEEGFQVPDTELRFVRELNTIEQWRV